MPAWIEFHDSTLLALNVVGTDVELLLDAYVHHWQMADGTWRGTGWAQPVRITVRAVVGEPAAVAAPAEIADGRMRLGAVDHDLVRLPLAQNDTVHLRLELVGGSLDIRGSGVLVETLGEARYVEDLPWELPPLDAG